VDEIQFTSKVELDGSQITPSRFDFQLLRVINPWTRDGIDMGSCSRRWLRRPSDS
jgi:hypothetical protein